MEVKNSSEIDLINGIGTDLSSNIEFSEFYNRYIQIAESGKLRLESFLEKSGDLGFKYGYSVAQRLFKVVSKGKPEILFSDYADYIFLSKSGSLHNRCNAAFQFISENNDQISYQNLYETIKIMYRTYNSLIGSYQKLTPEYFKQFHNELNIKSSDSIGFNQFWEYYNRDSWFLQWLNFFLFDVGFEENAETDQNKYRPNTLEKKLVFCDELLNYRFPTQTDYIFYETLPSDIPKTIHYEKDLGNPQINDPNETWDLLKKKYLYSEENLALIVPTLLQNIKTIKAEDQDFADKNSVLNYKESVKSNDYTSELAMLITLGVNYFSSPSLYKDSRLENSPKKSFIITIKTPKKISYKLTSHDSKIFLKLQNTFSLPYTSSFSLENLIKNLIRFDFSSEPWSITSGKSGSYFYYTPDRKYMLKTIQDKELEFLSIILPEYSSYIESSPGTFISKLLGCYSIKSYNALKTLDKKFIVMNNVFDTGIGMDMIFDLKGSTVSRTTESVDGSQAVLKDTDFQKSKIKIYLSDADKAFILNQIKLDCAFLEKMQVIDYSLLLGIHFITPDDSCFEYSTQHCYISSDRTCIYCLGIIDFLSIYNFKKKLENLFKTTFLGNGISCIPPDQYAQRFFKYIGSVLE
jgi:Phosphatidylinositol-4-phosphate 5-Kinase